LDRIDSLTGGLDHTYEYDFTGAGVRVYIPDSGVDGAQSDFKTLNNAGGTRVEPGTSMYPSTWIGIPGNTDTFAHGTEVASILGGLEYGVAKGVTIVPVRVLDSTGSGSMQGLLNALDWIVADANAQQSARNIINLSIDAAFSFALDAELKALGLANFVVVGAAGNEDSDACMRSPGGSSYVISVGSTAQATNGGDQISSFSNYGPCVSIFAPGSQVPGALANLDENEVWLSNPTRRWRGRANTGLPARRTLSCRAHPWPAPWWPALLLCCGTSIRLGQRSKSARVCSHWLHSTPLTFLAVTTAPQQP